MRIKVSFATADQILTAFQVLCSNAYGSMLWKVSSTADEQFFKCWTTGVKMVHGVLRSTFTYLVEGHLAAGHTSLRSQVLSRYSVFFRNVLESPSKEVRILSRIVSSDPRSTICSNLKYMEKLTGPCQTQFYSAARVRMALPVTEVPEKEHWRLGLLVNLMKMKQERYLRVEDTKTLCAMIVSLCST